MIYCRVTANAINSESDQRMLISKIPMSVQPKALSSIMEAYEWTRILMMVSTRVTTRAATVRNNCAAT